MEIIKIIIPVLMIIGLLFAVIKYRILPFGMQTVYDEAVKINLEQRSKLMTIRTFKELPWLDFMDFVSRKPAVKGQREVGPVGQLVDGENVKPASRAAIKMVEDFRPRKGGGQKMMMPVQEILKGNPTFGDKQLLGTGEKVFWAYEDLEVYQVRKAVSTSGGEFNKYFYAEYVDQIAEEAQPKLEDWWRRFMNAEFKYAFLEGRSLNLTAPKSTFGLGRARVVHPNIYMASGGWAGGVDYSAGRRPGSANYETDVATAFDTLTNADKLTVALLEKVAAIIVRDKNIEPSIENKYGAYYPVFLSSHSAWQLRQDPRFDDIRFKILPAMQQGKNPMENWFLNGAMGIVGPFILREDNQAFCVHTQTNPEGWSSVAAGKVRFGPEWASTSKTYTPMISNDNSKLNVAIILGRDAMYGGLGSRVEFSEEKWDHDNQSEAGSKMVYGLRRADAIDRDGFFGTADEFAWHQGSMLIGHYADPLS